MNTHTEGHQVSVRQYTTGPEPNQRGVNVPLYVAIGVAAVGGGYVYFKRHQNEVERLQDKVRTDEQEMRQRVREGTASARSRLEDAVHEGERKYEDVKVRNQLHMSLHSSTVLAGCS